MIGVPGIAHRLFGALKSANVSVMFIAQASSEHSICFAIKEIFCNIAKKAVEEAFFYELKNRLISCVTVINSCSIIAAVGESMGSMPGVAGIFFGALGAAGINVLSISQGCDERNISAVVYAKDSAKALRAAHSAFWLSSQNISVGIIGTGRVGHAVVQTLTEQIRVLEERFGLTVSIRGVASSTTMVLDDENLIDKFQSRMKARAELLARSDDSSDVTATNGRAARLPSPSISEESFNALEGVLKGEGNSVKRTPTDLEAFTNHIKNGPTPHFILIDCTNSQLVADQHPAWLRKGSHIVTANKRGLSNSLDLYNNIFAAVRAQNRMYMSEVTIGASIPVMTTLSDLLCSGDQVSSIVGLVSASVGQILTDICDNPPISFTQSVSRTFAQGLFEEDVFRDLEGTEAAQKLLILARELGVPMNLSDVIVEPIAKRRELESWDAIGSGFLEEDAIYARKAAAAAAKGCTLRYVQRIVCTPGAALGRKKKIHATASVKLEEVPLNSALAMVKGAVYHFEFHTARYNRNPLIVQVNMLSCCTSADFLVLICLILGATI